ncbi:uncharacterized protein LOC124359682 [Homalodisca vitripennis]|uniref:uncharacterized protein LOC124359682 n=1 Tax=Homalodisca vitripennis TaxID=197043 RepID=UPI001EEC442B|nr:uncharacterized protein LOC124359682 [Homalodisca vitripennis]
MGTCFGQLKSISRRRKRLYKLEHSHYNKNEDKVELHFLVEEEEIHAQETANNEPCRSKKICHRICSFLKPNCYKHIRGGHRMLEVETESRCESPSPSHSSVANIATDAEDVHLVTLDVRTLRSVQSAWRYVSLTPPSSIDLEWESDGIVGNAAPLCQPRLQSTTEECSTASVLEDSPAESLEWDSCEGALDTDTEQLLCEIERLTARALRETGGDWANR